MKLILAYIRTHKVDSVSLALRQIPGLTGLSASSARGWGHGKQEAEKDHHSDRVSDFDECVRIEVVCSDEIVDDVLSTIISSASTGLYGDGKIFVCPVLKAVHIRTGEEGDDLV